MVLIIVLFSLPLLIYIFCELSLTIAADTIDEISLLIAATLSPTYYDLRKKDEKLLKKSEEIKEMILKSKSWR